MNKIAYIVFFTFVGVIFNPMDIYACGSTAVPNEKSCCSKMEKSDANENGCSDKKNQKPCNGTCNNSNCSFTPAFSSLAPLLIFRIHPSFETIVLKKTNFFYLEKNISTHYFSVWSPPKIS